MSERAVSVTAAEAEALRGWVAREGASRTIEIGLGYGVSARAVCATNLGWKAEEVPATDDLHQWAVLWTPEAPPERSYDHFVDF